MNFILSFCDISIPPEPVITIVTFEFLSLLYILTKTSLKAFFTGASYNGSTLESVTIQIFLSASPSSLIT